MLEAELHRGRADPVIAAGDLDRAEPPRAVPPGRGIGGRLRQGLRQEDARHQVRKVHCSIDRATGRTKYVF